VQENWHSDREGVKSELDRPECGATFVNAATAMPSANLSGHNENIVALLIGCDLFKRRLGAHCLLKVTWTEFPFAVIAKAASV
jgi:hypothetical protein